jgi:hypothetical protein
MLVVAFVPSVAMGQYVRHEEDPFKGKPVPAHPVSVAKEILTHGDKDLALTDSQRTLLTRIQAHVDSLNGPLLRRLDSLRPTWRPAGGLGDLSPEQRRQLLAFREAEIAIVDSLTPSVTRANEQVAALLAPKQRDRAAKLEKEARKRAIEAAKHEFDSGPQFGGRHRRRDEIKDATDGPPLG